MENRPEFVKLVNLASSRLGTQVTYATDDFFADKQRLVDDEPAQWKEGVYDDNGKWMDGWESRRKREEGHDYCVVRLGLPGKIAGVDIDTSHFTGNYPPSASLEGCYCADGEPQEDQVWQELLSSMNLKGDSHHFVDVDCNTPFTHLRFHIYPDGGVARLRVYGQPEIDWTRVSSDQELDLVAVENGGRALACNDQHFGHMSNLIMPGRGVNMGDGWETARRRVPGNDWVILSLGHTAYVDRIAIDTAYFKGNYPDSVSIQAAYVEGGTDEQIATQSLFWRELLPSQKLSADNIHEFVNQVQTLGAISHVRVNIFPDGGISRVRLFGRKSD
ncbi:allantoicase [Enterovibrio nigricans]|uniref:Probable allantoicase n=1 Tax=Enterovibrio nigricans DSM 22720 TaxID=1121868 RepID=A0A1T4VGH0_9GAMM|nr:allantoicase [Enterovibrio nigricans]PKF49415.1 allantoicase [Enterovibrio nigricans]SKA64072.1 allantoicase [Enterovibrio nigricans DSM 22720]